MTSRTTDASPARGAEARGLLSASAVRQTARHMLALAEEGTLDDWALDVARLAPTADLVAQVIRERYPTLEVPFHARWRHFVFNGRDLWGELASATKWPNAAARAGEVRALVMLGRRDEALASLRSHPADRQTPELESLAREIEP